MNSRNAASFRTAANAWIIIFLFLTIWPAWPAYSQTAKKKSAPGKPSLDLLVTRIDSYWKLLMERKKTKAAEYVVSSERDRFLNNPVPSFSDPRIKSLEPSADRTEAKVTVNVKRNLPFGLMDWPVAARWVYKNANWYYYPYPEGVPGSNMDRRAAKIEQEEAQKLELRKILQFEPSVLDFGLVQRGAPVSLTLKYSLEDGQALPVRIDTSTGEMAIKGLNNGMLQPGRDQALTVTMPTQKFEGVVLESITLTAKRQNVEVPFKIPVQGFVYVPVSVTPSILRLNPGNETREKEILVRNNSRSTLELQSFAAPSDAVEVEGLPAKVLPGQPLALKVKQVRDAAQPNTAETLTIAFGQPVDAMSSIAVSVVLNASDKRDGLIYDPARDPNLQKQIRKNLSTAPKR